MTLLPKTPFSKANHFGLAITAAAVRAVEVDEQGKIVKQAEVVFPRPLLGESVLDETELRQHLLALKQQGRFNQPYVAVCIPEKYAFTREYQFPRLPLSEIGEALQWQIEKIFPFSKSDIYYDWKVLAQSPQQVRILITAVQKKLLDQLKNVIQSAGLFPISFEPSASALSRLLPSTDNAVSLITELDNQGSSSTLVFKGTSSLTTTTFFNTQSTPESVLTDLTQSLTTLIDYAKKYQYPVDKAQIVITGEKASPQLKQVLEPHLGYPVQLLSIGNLEPAYHLAYTAACRTVKPPEDTQSINLLPTALRDYYQAQMVHRLTQQAAKYVCILLVPALLLAVSGYLYTHFQTAGLKKQIAANQTALPQGSQVNMAALQQTAQKYSLLFSKKVSPENALTVLLESVPEEIVVSYLDYESDKNTFKLVGTAPQREDILNLKNILEASKIFTKVQLPLNSLENTEQIEFELKFELKKANPS